MKKLTNLVNSLLMAAWVGAIAIFSIQNVQGVSLKFLSWETIKLPVGVLLAFCLGFGFILSGLLPLLWLSSRRQ